MQREKLVKVGQGMATPSDCNLAAAARQLQAAVQVDLGAWQAGAALERNALRVASASGGGADHLVATSDRRNCWRSVPAIS